MLSTALGVDVSRLMDILDTISHMVRNQKVKKVSAFI